MTEISKKTGPTHPSHGYDGRWPADQDGRLLMGKLPPLPGKRESIRKKVSLEALSHVLDEKDNNYLLAALGNRRERRQMLSVEQVFMTTKERKEDNVNCQKAFNSFNRLIQERRNSTSSNNEVLNGLKNLYAETQPWWPVKHEIIFRTAEILVEN